MSRSGGLEVTPVEDRRGVEAFLRFPFTLYRGDPHWVPPLLMERRAFLDPRRNPIYEYAAVRLFLARRGGQVAGTIAAVRNDRYGAFHPDEAHVGFFGLYECVEDAEVSDALLEASARWLRGQGKTVMRGPTNLTTNDVMGLLVEGFEDDPVLLMPYNPGYYAAQLESFGLRKAKDLLAFEVVSERSRGRLDQAAARVLGRDRFTARRVDMRRWRRELEFVRRCYNEAWAANWGFVPWTDRELEFMASELKPLVDPALVHFVEANGEPVGFSIGVPDAHEALKRAGGRLLPLGLPRILWKLKVEGCRRIRVLALGVLPRWRRLGLETVLIQRTIHDGLERGYRRAEVGWVLEDNEAMIRSLGRIGAERTKRFRVYDRPV
jgi:GNAT superfamily N-acetyltransferase